MRRGGFKVIAFVSLNRAPLLESRAGEVKLAAKLCRFVPAALDRDDSFAALCVRPRESGSKPARRFPPLCGGTSRSRRSPARVNVASFPVVIMRFIQFVRHRALLLAAFAAVYVLWGSTYLAIALAVQSIPPFLMIGVRSIAARAILFGLAQFRSPGFPPARAWRSAAASGVLLFGGCHGALAYAERYVPSGLAAVMLATIPFWLVLIRFVISVEDRPKVMTLAALVAGLAGVALFMAPSGPQETGPIAPLMVLILLGAAFMWAAGSIISQRQNASISAVTSASMQLLCGGAALLVASSLNGELTGFSPSQVSAVSWAGLAYLTIAGSVVAFAAYVWLLDHARAPLVATYTFVNPIIAIGLGWAVLGEHLTLQMLAGFSLVVVSVIAVWRLEASAPVERA